MARKVVATTESETIEDTAEGIADVASQSVIERRHNIADSDKEVNRGLRHDSNPITDTDEDNDESEDEEDDDEDEGDEDEDEEGDEATPSVRRPGRPRKEGLTITTEDLEAKLEPEVLSLVTASQQRDWRTQRATEQEKHDLVVAGLKIEALGSTSVEVAKLLGLSYATYNNWKSGMGQAVKTRRGRKDKNESTPTMYRGTIPQPREHSFTLSQSVMQMIVRENAEAVLDMLLLGKPEGIKEAIKLLLQA